MEIIGWVVVLILGGYFFFKKNTERGQRFVRAYVFLVQINHENTVAEANEAAAFPFTQYSDTDSDNLTIRLAQAYAAELHGGKQLPVIEEARNKGFRG